MVESLLYYTLGPHGRYLGGLLLKYQFPIVCAVFIFAFYKIFRLRWQKKGERKEESQK